MRRRNFITLTTLGGLGLALGSHRYLSYKYPLKFQACSSFATTTSSPQLRLIAVGDVGTGDPPQYSVAKTISCYYHANPFPFALLLGDNIYKSGEINKIDRTFEVPYKELLKQQVKFYAVIGNHDILTNQGIDQINYPGFNMQGRYYTFTQKNVQFFALDTNPEAPWLEQFNWLESNLSASTKPWKIVFGHHQIYASGKRGINPELIARLTPLFARYGVQLYLNGHEHHYERTIPIKGTTYLTCGAGSRRRSVGKSDWTAYSVSQLSFAVIEVYSERLEIQGIDTKGNIFDRAAIYQRSLT